MEVRAGRSNRETKSPERMKLYVQPKMKPFKKVQILYYLCRNGQLEHPHFMEVSHLANHQLRLKDVIDRLIILRGKNMPCLFSWSCKRSYKNGYVWNDLDEHDVIYPADGAEYVLKGSELIEGCAERFQQLQVMNKQQNPKPNLKPNRKLPKNRVSELVYMRAEEEDDDDNDNDDEEEEEQEEEESNTSSNSRCSRGVSTDELDSKTQNNNPTEISLEEVEDSSPPSTSSTVSEKTPGNNSNSQRFVDESVIEPIVMTRSSALFQLITCGSSVVMNKQRNSCMNSNARKSSSLHKGVLCKSAINKMSEEDEINYMSENPRFGNPQSEEKEYFSGSIVESMTEERVATEPTLKKSSSYNADRSSSKSRLGETEVAVEKVIKTETVVKSNSSSCMISMKGKCIPTRNKKSQSTKKSCGGGE